MLESLVVGNKYLLRNGDIVTVTGKCKGRLNGATNYVYYRTETDSTWSVWGDGPLIGKITTVETDKDIVSTYPVDIPTEYEQLDLFSE
jgi:hypothetical protein